jgi:hypothetical protein
VPFGPAGNNQELEEHTNLRKKKFEYKENNTRSNKGMRQILETSYKVTIFAAYKI